MTNSLILLCATGLAVCGIAVAQSSSDVVKARLSQPVMVGSVQFPAGDCTVSIVSQTGNTTLLIRSESGAKAMVLANPINNHTLEVNRPSLSLSLRDGAYRLDQVWLSFRGAGYQIIGPAE